MNDSFDIYTLIFLGLAIFVFIRLRAVLGTRTGHERPPSDPYTRREAPQPVTHEDKLITLPSREQQADAGLLSAAQRSWNNAVEEKSAAATGLHQIAEADSDFNITTFLKNAASAYEIIVSAFGTGDRETLKNLLRPDVFQAFSEAMMERESRGEMIETDFVSIRPERVSEAFLEGDVASITVEFRSDVISVTRNKTGEIVSGSSEEITEIKDVWTFSRALASSSPVWLLSSTGA